MATLIVYQAALAGVKPTYAAAAAGGDTFKGDPKCVIRAVNSHSASQTVTLASKKTAVAGLAPADNAVAIPAGEERVIALDPAFIDGDGNVNLTYSGVTALTVAVIRGV